MDRHLMMQAETQDARPTHDNLLVAKPKNDPGAPPRRVRQHRLPGFGLAWELGIPPTKRTRRGLVLCRLKPCYSRCVGSGDWRLQTGDGSHQSS